MHKSFYFVDHIAYIRPRTVTIFPRVYSDNTAKSEAPIWKKPTHLSSNSQSRIINAVESLIEMSIRKKVYELDSKKWYSFKVGFMTLTIPEKQKHTDIEFHYKVFAPFIRVLKNKYDLGEFVWKAEAQDNGNLHYHLTINVFIHHADIKKEWNKQLEKAGYNFKTEGHRNATTQIKATKNIKNLANYLCGYLSKKDFVKKKYKKITDTKMIDGTMQCELPPDYYHNQAKYLKRIINMKLWSCSTNLLKCRDVAQYSQAEDHNIFDEIKRNWDRKKIFDFCEVYEFNYTTRKKCLALNNRITAMHKERMMKNKQSEIYKIQSIK